MTGNQFDGEVTAYEIGKFHEKPYDSTARKYFNSSNYLWNMGYLVLTPAVFKSLAEEFSPEFYKAYENLLEAEDTDKAYLGLDNIALEYVFSEKIKGALVIPGTFDWVDVGSFKDLHNISAQDGEGNFVKGTSIEVDGATNCFLQNETDTPLAVIGVDNVVVVSTPNGILVTNKNYAQKVGDVAKRIQESK